jgi:hypothetical protein
MRNINKRFGDRARSVGTLVTALCVVLTPAFAQNSSGQKDKGDAPARTAKGDFDKVVILPPGGPAPRMSDGHVDLTGRYYPNQGGRMLDSVTPGQGGFDRTAFRQFDPKVTPEEKPIFKPGMAEKYKSPVPYGVCDQAGTPSAWTMQENQHAPMELVQSPQRLMLLTEYPLDVRMIYTNGRQHPKDPDPTFNGDSAAHWEGDTLVVDVIAIDDRLRNVSVGFSGEGNAWLHSDQEHIIERFSRPSKNYLVYQFTVEDPVVLAQPWHSVPRKWSLAAPDDEWGEVFCTHNEEPEEWKHMDKKVIDDYEKTGSKVK